MKKSEKSLRIHQIYAVICLLSFFCATCQNQSYELTETLNPSCDNTASDLISQDFEKVSGVDMPLLFKEKEDTTVVASFDHDRKTMLGKSWHIKTDLDKHTIDDLLKSLKVREIGRGPLDSLDMHQSIILYSSKTNALYSYRLENRESKFVIHYYCPTQR